MKKNNTVLVIDSGGRGAALIHKYSQSPHVKKLLAVPGNDLMPLNCHKPLKIYPTLKTTSISEIIEICKRGKVDLIDVAQDNAVEVGLTDVLIKHGFKVIGPAQAAGQIEWDKAWARDFMKKYKIPSPFYKVFSSQKDAVTFIKKTPHKKWFIKASGLAEGKGALPAATEQEAISAIEAMTKFGKAGDTFIIEEWLEGEEFSMFAVSDGNTYQMIGSAQDHKRLYDGDSGPNTGGIGCSTPPLVVDKKIYVQAEKIISTTLRGLRVEGRPYKGILYLGAMVVNSKVFVIEFNARWGDPEAEVLVPGIESDVFLLAMHVADGTLKTFKVKTDGRARVVVTGSLRPGVETKKRELFGVEKLLKINDVTLYGTRVARKNKKYFVSSGRLFHVVGEGKTILEARQKAYDALSILSIEGNNLHFRTDIGWRDVERFYAQNK